LRFFLLPVGLFLFDDQHGLELVGGDFIEDSLTPSLSAARRSSARRRS
jgi:hypothetical protein